MEPLSPQGLKRSLVASNTLILTLLCGCVTTGSLLHPPDKPPIGTPSQVVATWSKEIISTPDPANRGAPVLGLAGRIHLFAADESGHPILGDGCLVVDLFDDAPMASGQAPVMLEEWRFDKDTLKRLAKRDFVGWGYTVFLPWGSYRPDIRHIHLRVRYDPAKGIPVYSESSTMAVAHPYMGGTPARTLAGRSTPRAGELH